MVRTTMVRRSGVVAFTAALFGVGCSNPCEELDASLQCENCEDVARVLCEGLVNEAIRIDDAEACEELLGPGCPGPCEELDADDLCRACSDPLACVDAVRRAQEGGDSDTCRGVAADPCSA